MGLGGNKEIHLNGELPNCPERKAPLSLFPKVEVNFEMVYQEQTGLNRQADDQLFQGVHLYF
jgi:hypothetical protein